jgi:hypothetical protein
LEKVKQAATGEFATSGIIGAVNWLVQDSLQRCTVNSVFGDFVVKRELPVVKIDLYQHSEG